MGLAISRSIVEAHGGRLWTERRAAGGLMMRFTLPATVTRTTADHPLQPSAPANVAPGLDQSAITD
jgi:hypothetical protein